MSILRADSIRDREGIGAPNFPNGVTVTGVVTATTLSLSGNATVSGNLTVNGTTTTIDTVVTEVDRLEVGANSTTVGVAITQSGTGAALKVDGKEAIFSEGLIADGFKVEEGKYNGAYSQTGVFAFNFDEGHVQEYSAATTANYVPNFRINVSTTLNSQMDVGDVTAATLIVASSSHYCLNTLQVDGSAAGITTSWIGGSAPSSANGSGYDIYAFTIMKTSATPTYHIIANATYAA